VQPFTVSADIARPAHEVFEYLADIANHAEFTDHYLVDWRLTREDSYGQGAGARFRVKAPLNRFAWADMTFAELRPPTRLVERGRGGKYNRVKMIGTYELSEPRPGVTRVSYTYETDPHVLSDVIRESLGGRAWARRQAKRSLKRLRAILEQNRMRGARPSIAAR
jgi:uncharacterized protein YndB with AHSA1/START domain